MIDVDTVRERDIQNATGKAGVTIRDLLRIHFNGHIHGKEGDVEFLRRRNRRHLINVRIRTTHNDMVTLFHGGQLLQDGIHWGSIAGVGSDVLPNNLSGLVYDEHGRTRNPLCRMEYAVLLDEVLVYVRKDGISQLQLRGHFLPVGGTVCADRNHLGAETLDLRVVCLQLTELRAAKPSSLRPVKDD